MLIRNRACIDLNLNKTIAPSGHSLHHELPVLSVSQVLPGKGRGGVLDVGRRMGWGIYLPPLATGWLHVCLDVNAVQLSLSAQFSLGSSNSLLPMPLPAWMSSWPPLCPRLLYSTQNGADKPLLNIRQ